MAFLGKRSLAFVITLLPIIAAAQQPLTRSNMNRRLAPSEWLRSRMVQKMDKQGLRFKTTAVSDCSDDMLRIPDILEQKDGFTIAQKPPVVDLVIVPVNPRFFFEPPDKKMGVGLWTAWSQGTYHPPIGKFYGAVGNHIFYDSRLHIVTYDPHTKSVQISPEINTLLGLPIDYGDGKIHGYLDFYNGNTMYFCTYWTEYPQPSESQFQSGYEGGRLLSYDVETGKLTDFGVPMKRVSWPYHRLDAKRGLMYAVGSLNEFMCYDIKSGKLVWAGYPPDGMTWHDRNMLLDEQTGCVYSSNLNPEDPDVHIIKYDPQKNRFFKMKSCVPKTECKCLLPNQIRAHTPRRSKDGWFVCITRSGRMFKFYPDEDRVEDLGFCWPAACDKLYTTSLAISPDDRYVYYIPAAHGGAHRLGAPVVQYNTQTGERKALAFLFPYLYEKYGYIAGGTFSISIDEKGERLFILMNGAFNEFDPNGGDVFGDPSVIVIHIPESER